MSDNDPSAADPVGPIADEFVEAFQQGQCPSVEELARRYPTIASGSEDHTVRLWDADVGESRLTFTGHTDQLRGLIFTPDGQTVPSCGRDRTIQAWIPRVGACGTYCEATPVPVHDLALGPDGRTLASASHDRTLKLWEAAPAVALSARP
jgi:WD40 repeat protein